jgi:hypothetical protein
MRRTRVSTKFFSILIVAGLTFGCSISQVQGAASDPGVLRFDAEWWHQADSDEQQGFIYGYRDCRQPANAPIVSIVDEQAFVSKAVDSQKPKTPDAVTVAIHLAWKTMKSQKIEKGAEVFTGPHGFLDGEWWGEFTGPWPSDVATMDRGYLEGYLECSSAPVTIQAVRRYQAALNRHYGSGHHSHDKIADVLQRLLKPPVSSQK